MSNDFPIKCPIDGKECRSRYTCNACSKIHQVRVEDKRPNPGLFATCLRMGVEVEALQRRRAAVIASRSPKEDNIMSKPKKEKKVKGNWPSKALEWLKDNPSKDGKGHRPKDIAGAIGLPSSWAPHGILIRAIKRGDIIKLGRGRLEHKDHVKRDPVLGYSEQDKVDIRERVHKILKALEGLSPHMATMALKAAEQHVHYHSKITLPGNMTTLLEEAQAKSEEIMKKVNGSAEPGMMHT